MALHEQGRLDEADSLYAGFIDAHPTHRQAIRLRAILARQCAEYERSIALLTRLAELAPGDAVPVCELGLTCLARGDLFAAEQSLREAVRLDPENLAARVNLGAVLQRRGYFSAAAEQYVASLNRAPDDVEIGFNLASAQMESGHGEQALETIAAMLDRVPGHPVALASQGAILCALERYAEAVEVIEQAIPAETGDDMALINLAFARRHLDDPAAAAVALEAAARINPANARAVADLANTELELGRVDSALSRCRDFLARYPGERLVLAAYGITLAAAGLDDEAQALNDYDQLVTIIDCEVPEGFESLQRFTRNWQRSCSLIRRGSPTRCASRRPAGRKPANLTHPSTRPWPHLSTSSSRRRTARLNGGRRRVSANIRSWPMRPGIARSGCGGRFSSPVVSSHRTVTRSAGSAACITCSCPKACRMRRTMPVRWSLASRPTRSGRRGMRIGDVCHRPPAGWCCFRPGFITARCRSRLRAPRISLAFDVVPVAG